MLNDPPSRIGSFLKVLVRRFKNFYSTSTILERFWIFEIVLNQTSLVLKIFESLNLTAIAPTMSANFFCDS